MMDKTYSFGLSHIFSSYEMFILHFYYISARLGAHMIFYFPLPYILHLTDSCPFSK
jgi:hypothetical protein